MKNNLKGFLFLLPAILLVIVFIILPFAFAIGEAFKVKNSLIFSQFSLGTDNFTTVANERLFLISFRNSNFLLFITMPITLLFSLWFAFLINSLKIKWLKKLITTTYFSQFFVSIYAIGMSFIFLFDVDKNVFNQIFNTNIRFSDDSQGFTSLLTLSIFLAWRLFSFNFIFIYFSLAKISEQKIAMAKLDNLNFINRWKHLYYPEIRKTLIMLIYLNMLEAVFLFPDAIFKDPSGILLYDASTLANYIYYWLTTGPDYAKAAVGSIFTILYLIGLVSFYFSIKFTVKVIKNGGIKNVWKLKFMKQKN
ncbi:carbohydrate ABC transporter permease [Mycoplasmopsis agassizii]|uniref:Sugar ABC transporter permease n=1 Tax=Mycoplasmopsis agassizii TaxID=33922 RepID=A0ABX4H6A6_9BACT|nr:sugar ABC transporter permease [Mycoplasmopsis agassizii]PAF55415.1 sugar ABC transporter permease [Mycoplasmopsis agassizii]SMC18339.1 multiple sugar transport system permease protein [Mycoplasmopsis agassizii]